jgi:hypothetical protein
MSSPRLPFMSDNYVSTLTHAGRGGVRLNKNIAQFCKDPQRQSADHLHITPTLKSTVEKNLHLSITVSRFPIKETEQIYSITSKH